MTYRTNIAANKIKGVGTLIGARISRLYQQQFEAAVHNLELLNTEETKRNSEELKRKLLQA